MSKIAQKGVKFPALSHSPSPRNFPPNWYVHNKASECFSPLISNKSGNLIISLYAIAEKDGEDKKRKFSNSRNLEFIMKNKINISRICKSKMDARYQNLFNESRLSIPNLRVNVRNCFLNRSASD
jgi:hypothetical protein